MWLPEWADPDHQAIRSGYIEAGPRYFETLRTPVLRGREFEEADAVNAPSVAIVNQTLATRLWPSGNALGATVVLRRGPHRVVGIVADVPVESRADTAKPYIYVPYWQNPGQVDARLCVRVAGDPAAMLATLTREVNRVDPDVPIAETITLPLQMAGIFRPLRMSAAVLSYAAGLAVFLSAIGLYGTLSFAVSRRTKEIGIRMAIGAEGKDVLAMIVREGMAFIVVGAVAGLALAGAGAQLVAHLLLKAASGDTWLYASAGLLVAAAGLLACWVPARRAAGVEPLIALRDE